jgi:CMP-2-keto-3-deoxyoctulosonic acid synthetase
MKLLIIPHCVWPRSVQRLMTSPHHGSGTDRLRTDDRMISAEHLHTEVCEGNRLSTENQEDLCKVLAKYQQHITK